MPPFQSAAVAAVINAYPPQARAQCLALRELIYRVAADTPGVGELTETLKWGEPAYLTAASRSGSTLRLGWKASKPTCIGLYFICTTDLLSTFRTMFPHDFVFEGNRALLFELGVPLASDALAVCIELALTYRVRRAPGRKAQAGGLLKRAKP